jgi:hypothetical protein
MLMDSTPPSKDAIWQTELKMKMEQSVVYLLTLIHRNKHCLWVKGWKKIYQTNGT